MVADFASFRMRREWQELHFASAGEGRRWPYPQRRACGQSGRSGIS